MLNWVSLTIRLLAVFVIIDPQVLPHLEAEEQVRPRPCFRDSDSVHLAFDDLAHLG